MSDERSNRREFWSMVRDVIEVFQDEGDTSNAEMADWLLDLAKELREEE